MEGYRVYKLEIDHFRGYRDKKEFDLCSLPEITVLSGPNGFGKTSFFDAMEWGFTGKLTRYCEPNEERNNSRFINFQPEEKDAKVVIEFGDETKKYILTRQVAGANGRSTDYGLEKSILSIKDENGNEFRQEKARELINELLITDEWKGKMDFEEVFSQYHLLTQDKLKNFVQGIKATDRYKQISQLFGTERFLDYYDKFKNFKNSVDKVISTEFNEKEEICKKIELLKIQTSATMGMNLGNYTNFDEYSKSLIKEYNEIVNNINVNEFNKTLNVETIRQFKIVINENKDFINKKLFDLDQEYKALQEIEINKDSYSSNKSYFSSMQKIIPSINILNDCNYIVQNLEELNSFITKRQKAKEAQNNVINQKNKSDNYLFKLRQLYQNIERMQIDIKNIKEEKEILSSFDLKSIINILSTNQTNFIISDEYIKIEIKDNTSYITLDEYKAKIEATIENKFIGSMQNVYNITVSKTCNELLESLKNINDKEIEREKIQNSILYIKGEIDQLNQLEKETSQILNDTLLFLKKQNVDFNNKIGCPVCNTEFYLSELIKRIEEKIAHDNPIIREKLDLLNELETRYKILNNEFEILYESKVILPLENFLLEHEYYRNAISSLGIYLKARNSEQDQNIKNYDENIKNLEENYEKLVRKINQIKLTGDFNTIKSSIFELKLYHLSVIKDLGFDPSNIEVDQIEKESNKISTSIRIFENKLASNKIEIDNIDEVLMLRKRKMEYNSNSLNLALQNINTIEIKVLECEKFLITNRNLVELDLLKEKLKDVEKKINNMEMISAEIQTLQNATKTSVENLNQKIVDQSEDLINIIFNRIYTHPSFRNLKLCIDFNRRDNNVLYLQCKNKDNRIINPAFTFSSAQVNVIAISIFLALSLEQRCTKLEQVFLDDPIQDMDDINVLSFVDIMRSIVSSDKFNKCFVLSTHDEQFYRLMVKKFRFMNTRVFRFSDYNCDGPFFSHYDTLINPKELLLDYKEFDEEIKKIDRDSNTYLI